MTKPVVDLDATTHAANVPQYISTPSVMDPSYDVVMGKVSHDGTVFHECLQKYANEYRTLGVSNGLKTHCINSLVEELRHRGCRFVELLDSADGDDLYTKEMAESCVSSGTADPPWIAQRVRVVYNEKRQRDFVGRKLRDAARMRAPSPESTRSRHEAKFHSHSNQDVSFDQAAANSYFYNGSLDCSGSIAHSTLCEQPSISGISILFDCVHDSDDLGHSPQPLSGTLARGFCPEDTMTGCQDVIAEEKLIRAVTAESPTVGAGCGEDFVCNPAYGWPRKTDSVAYEKERALPPDELGPETANDSIGLGRMPCVERGRMRSEKEKVSYSHDRLSCMEKSRIRGADEVSQREKAIPSDLLGMLMASVDARCERVQQAIYVSQKRSRDCSLRYGEISRQCLSVMTKFPRSESSPSLSHRHSTMGSSELVPFSLANAANGNTTANMRPETKNTDQISSAAGDSAGSDADDWPNQVMAI
jgi:hypothetical protein